jgi:hypothetical protein
MMREVGCRRPHGCGTMVPPEVDSEGVLVAMIDRYGSHTER